MTFIKDKVTLCIIAGFVSFILTTSAYAVVSSATPVSVGFKPIATKSLTAVGAHGTSEVVTLSGFGLTDVDENLLDTIETIKTVQLYIIDSSTAVDLGSKGDDSVTIPTDATGKRLVLKYTVKTLTGTPDTAHEETDIILSVANGGGSEIGQSTAVNPIAITVKFTADLTCVTGTSCDDV